MSYQYSLRLNETRPNTIHDHPEEAYFLAISVIVGIVFNFLIFLSVFMRHRLRRATSSFIVHGAALDMVKTIYCVPFIQSVFTGRQPQHCEFLGGSYMIMVTATTFNMIGMVSAEVFFFSDNHKNGHSRRALELRAQEEDSHAEDAAADERASLGGKGSACCVCISIFLVYIGALIIHLGPTIIAGSFRYDNRIGNCVFEYGSVTSTVVHIVWITVTSLTFVVIFYFLGLLYRQIARKSAANRITTLVRHPDVEISSEQRRRMIITDKNISYSLSRVRVLFVVAATFVGCWYPLFITTLSDPGFELSVEIYRFLTFLAWSNASITPVLFVLFDKNFSVLRQVVCCKRCLTEFGSIGGFSKSRKDQGDTLVPLNVTTHLPDSDHTHIVFELQEKIGTRLFREGVRKGTGTVPRYSDFSDLELPGRLLPAEIPWDPTCNGSVLTGTGNSAGNSAGAGGSRTSTPAHAPIQEPRSGAASIQNPASNRVEFPFGGQTMTLCAKPNSHTHPLASNNSIQATLQVHRTKDGEPSISNTDVIPSDEVSGYHGNISASFTMDAGGALSSIRPESQSRSQSQSHSDSQDAVSNSSMRNAVLAIVSRTQKLKKTSTAYDGSDAASAITDSPTHAHKMYSTESPSASQRGKDRVASVSPSKSRSKSPAAAKKHICQAGTSYETATMMRLPLAGGRNPLRPKSPAKRHVTRIDQSKSSSSRDSERSDVVPSPTKSIPSSTTAQRRDEHIQEVGDSDIEQVHDISFYENLNKQTGTTC